MRTQFLMSGSLSTSRTESCDALLLGRLGSELGRIYHDTLQSPLPPQLQHLIDRLEASCCARAEARSAEPDER